jgi:hypothetical protein
LKITTWIPLLVALALLGALGGIMLSSREGDPRELLESALQRVEGPEVDRKGALDELDYALHAAQAEGEKDLIADILTSRARVLRSLSAWGPARSDLELVLASYRPDDLTVELELAEIDVLNHELDQALARVGHIVERDPTLTQAWKLRGQILTRLSDERLSAIKTYCQTGLPDEECASAIRLAENAVGMDPGDPLRIAVLHGLRTLFQPPDQLQAREILESVDIASDQNAQARRSFAQSFSGEIDREALLGYLQLLQRAGRHQEAIDFGLAGATQRQVRTYPPYLELLASILLEAERPRAAADSIHQFLDRGTSLSQSFLTVWADALRRSERWKELQYVAGQLRQSGDALHRSYAFFYEGLTSFRAKNFHHALAVLDNYVRHAPQEPYPGAITDAWRVQASCAHQLKNLGKERESRLAVIRHSPDANGEDWMRMFEITRSADPGANDLAEDYLTHAMCLMPARVPELMPTWVEIGRQRLKASGTELELVLAELRRQGRAIPSAESGPYELLRLAEIHAVAKETVEALAACDRLLANYPGFLPAIDLKAELARSMGDYPLAAELVLEHLRRGGSDAPTLRRLARLPSGSLDDRALQELMKLDPENTGRLQVARTLQAQGSSHAALAGLTALPLDALGGDGRLLAAELMLEVGRCDEALGMLEALSPSRREEERSLALAIRSAMKLGDPSRLGQVLTYVETVLAPDVRGEGATDGGGEGSARRLALADGGSSLIACSDELLMHGEVEEARRLLAALDRTRFETAESFNATILMRLAAVGLLRHDKELAQECLERAEAFEQAGLPEFGRLLIALEGRSWSRLPLLVRELTDKGFKSTRVQAVVLSILDERMDEARRMIEENRRAEPREPVWRLLLACLDVLRGRSPGVDEVIGEDNAAETRYTLEGGEGPHDPRPFLARLLALESREWRVWAVSDLLRHPLPASGSLWANYLAARGLNDMGQPAEAERRLRLVTRSFPTFAPAWNEIEALKLKRIGRFDAEELVRLREERRKALGRRPGEEAEELLTESWTQESAGNLDAALELARRASELDPELVPALYKLAQLQARAGDWSAASAAFHRAASFAEVSSSSPIVADFTAMLAAARDADPQRVSPAMVLEELEELARRFDRDPLAALALARAELRNTDLSPAIAVERAYERLDRMRERAPRTALDELRPGSARQWKDFYQGLDPARAEEFVRRELALEPGSLDLWLMLGETFQAQERRREAVELYELVQRMVPDGKTRRAIASLLASSGADPNRVEQNLHEACRLEGRQAPDADMEFTLARALLNGGPEQRARGLDILAALWQQRRSAQGSVTEIDIGQLYGTALVQRADPRDRELASGLLSSLAPRIEDASRRNLVEALSALALQIPAKTRP